MAASNFSEWMTQNMERVGIRSGRRLALETGLDEEMLLDWAIGRRVPQPFEVERLAGFFRTSQSEAQLIRARTEQLLAIARANR